MLSNGDIKRYSRQLILNDIGVDGQVKLKGSAVLVVGAGGLGCPAAAYLAAAGVGTLGVIDYDVVEIDNLHRQILHVEDRVGVNKASSLVSSLQKLNSSIVYRIHEDVICSKNAKEILEPYDIVLDCTDNVPTRYLLNDACVLLKKPLVSGSALRLEGQLTIYNYKGSPCYRCLFPSPPPPNTVTNCSDGGVLGVVPGIMGGMQALEAIKIVTGIGQPCKQKLILFDALSTRFREVKLRERRKNCAVCGESPSITDLIDYEMFCGSRADDKHESVDILREEDRVNALEYKGIVDLGAPHVLVDTRPPVELGICALPSSVNIPMSSTYDLSSSESVSVIRKKCEEAGASDSQPLPVFVVCRRGNDSQIMVEKLRSHLSDLPVTVKDLRGGLRAWAEEVDPSFPVY